MRLSVVSVNERAGEMVIIVNLVVVIVVVVVVFVVVVVVVAVVVVVSVVVVVVVAVHSAELWKSSSSVQHLYCRNIFLPISFYCPFPPNIC